MKSFILLYVTLIAILFSPFSGANAELSRAGLMSAQAVASLCIGRWDSKPCLRISANETLTMLSRYGEQLKTMGQNSAFEVFKEQCAASAGVTRGDYPAYAVVSAYTECANSIVDVSQKVGVTPDASQYQLFIGTILCLQKDPQCDAIEQGLSQYR